MRLTINQLALARSSRGVQRYAELLLPGIREGIARARGVVETLAPGSSSIRDRGREWMYRTDGNEWLWTPCQRGSLLAHHQVITVHDCINIEHVHRDDWRIGPFMAIFNRILHRAQVVVAISEATRAAVLRCYRVDPEKVVVIRSPSDLPLASANRRPPELPLPFVLMVTNALPHKNTLLACRALAASRLPREGLSLCSVGTLSAEARQVCVQAGIRLVECQNIDDATLGALYRDCAFLFSPSLAEGHNLAIAEARCAGAPVLCSDIPVHREFFEGQVTFFDPTELDAAVQALESIWVAMGPQATRVPAVFGRGVDSVVADYLDLFGRLDERYQ